MGAMFSFSPLRSSNGKKACSTCTKCKPHRLRGAVQGLRPASATSLQMSWLSRLPLQLNAWRLSLPRLPLQLDAWRLFSPRLPLRLPSEVNAQKDHRDADKHHRVPGNCPGVDSIGSRLVAVTMPAAVRWKDHAASQTAVVLRGGFQRVVVHRDHRRSIPARPSHYMLPAFQPGPAPRFSQMQLQRLRVGLVRALLRVVFEVASEKT